MTTQTGPTGPQKFQFNDENLEYQARVDHEDDLINQRFTWMILSQAFLLIALIYLRNDPKFFVKFSDISKESDLLFYIEMELFVYSIILIGTIISFFTARGISAACHARVIWRRMGELHPFANYNEYFHSISSAGAASYLIGWAFLWIWIVLGITELAFLLFSRNPGWELVGSIVGLIFGLIFICCYHHHRFKSNLGLAVFKDPVFQTKDITLVTSLDSNNFIKIVGGFILFLIIIFLITHIKHFQSKEIKNKSDNSTQLAITIILKGSDGKNVLDKTTIEVSKP